MKGLHRLRIQEQNNIAAREPSERYVREITNTLKPLEQHENFILVGPESTKTRMKCLRQDATTSKVATSKAGSPLVRLKAARIDAGLLQKQLGINAGIHEFAASARMNQYEKGTHTPNFQTVRSLAEVLAVPAAYFYAEDDDLAVAILTFEGLDKKGKKQVVETEWGLG